MHAMQDTNIKNRFVDDTIFNQINKRFISLDPDDVKEKNRHLIQVLEELIKIMRSKNSLFDKMYNRFVWVGSFYKKTKVGSPEEYDLNVVIKLPISEKHLTLSTNQPGYIKIRVALPRDNLCDNLCLKLNSKEYREMMSFIDDQSYLNQEKFRGWMEGILNTVAIATTNTNNQIKLGDYILTMKKSGPAFTLSLLILNGSTIDIDLVPVLAFSKQHLSKCCNMKQHNLQEFRDRFWFAVPKPLKKEPKTEQHRYWRLSFYDFEKDILSKYGRAKPVIRHLKKFRDTQNWKNIASYYIETLCLHHLQIFENSERVSNTYLFFTMLQKLREAFCNSCIESYWVKKVNLLENIGNGEMMNIERRLFHILRDIEKNILDDRYAIAKYVLNSQELATLISKPEAESEPEQTLVDQWKCVIV